MASRKFLALCCIIKDELNLEEWLVYNHVIGFDHFYIYDNSSKTPIRQRLNNDFFKDKCTIIRFPGKAQQLNAYQHCVENYKDNARWMAFIDGDEYILPKEDETLKGFLKKRLQYDAIGINWVMFGTNGHVEDPEGYVINSFTSCEGVQNQHIKSIINPKKITFFRGPHHARIKDPSKFVNSTNDVITGPFNHIETTHIIQINHYFVRSLTNFRRRRNRGNADVNRNRYDDENLLHGKPIMSYYNDVKDMTIANKYLDKVDKIFVKYNINRKFNIDI